MKTILPCAAVILSVALLTLVGESPSFGAESPATSQERVYKGTVTAIDPVEKTVSVKGVLFSKTFNTADTCKVSLEDKPEASLAELHPGQKVEVYYQNALGVLVARQIVQHNLVLNGHITAIDPVRRTLSIKVPAGTKDFTIAEDCTVILRDERVGTLDNLKIGHTVNVAYDPAAGSRVAKKIEQKAETFVGKIQAIDAGTRTVRARSFMTEKKFKLADECQIVVEGKSDAGLSGLRIGDQVAFSYEDANGVLVANRIGRDSIPPDTETAQAAKVVAPLR